MAVALEPIVTELLENAVVHNSNATPRIPVTVEHDTEMDRMELRISDDGDGISNEIQDLIEHGEETPLEHLSGLGLWLVHWTIEQSGGTIRIEENDWGGTTVIARFQVARETTEGERTEEEKEETGDTAGE